MTLPRPTSLTGRSAIVTGGSSGIGLATARALAEDGARVVACDVRPPPASIDGVLYREVDVTKREDVQALFDWATREHGQPDLLVSNAGVGIHERLHEGDPEKWARVLDTNVMGALRMIRAFVPGMLAEGGDVVLVSSVAATRPYAWGGVYCASKAALEAIAEVLRMETPPHVRVTVVEPGAVATEFFSRASGHPGIDALELSPLPPDEVAAAILHAVRRPSGSAWNRVTLRPSNQAL